MTTLWELSDGEYSDYHIIGVYSTEENAEAAAKIFGGTVGPITLDPGVDQVRAGLSPWEVSMRQDGNNAFALLGYRPNEKPRGMYKIEAYMGFSKERLLVLHADVWARDKEHAIKIVNELRARLIATNAFVPTKWGEINQQ
jgi:hypothetical protein